MNIATFLPQEADELFGKGGISASLIAIVIA